MTLDDLPACLCGACKYRSGGATLGSRLSSQWFICEACGRPHLVLSREATVLLCPTALTSEFPQEGLDYINGALDVTMRAYDAAAQSVRQAMERVEWDLRLDLLGLPRGTKIEFGGEPRGRVLVRPDGSLV